MSSQAQHRQTGPVSPPPPAKRHTPRAGSHTACSDPTPPATGRHPSHSANLVKQQHRASQWSRTAAQIPRYPPPTASDHQRPAAGSAPSFCTAAAAPVASFSARRSPPPSDPSWGRHRQLVDCIARRNRKVSRQGRPAETERHKWLCCRRKQKRQARTGSTDIGIMKCQCDSATRRTQTSDGTIHQIELAREQQGGTSQIRTSMRRRRSRSGIMEMKKRREKRESTAAE